MIIIDGAIDEDVFEDKYMIDPELRPGYEVFFENFDRLTEVFKFCGDSIAYNENLSDAEIIEIRDYIDQNHKLALRIRRRK